MDDAQRVVESTNRKSRHCIFTRFPPLSENFGLQAATRGYRRYQPCVTSELLVDGLIDSINFF